jgi:hypothetical protein
MEALTDNQLDEKIEQLNYWLNHHQKLHPQYRQKEHSRNYYVGKRIELAGI